MASLTSNKRGQRFNRVHAICRYLKHAPSKRCLLCPARENFGPGAARGVRGCYLVAKEVYNIARYGNPWGKRGTKHGIRHWRRRFNRD